MSLIREATEILIRLVKKGLHAEALLIPSDDLFEVKRTPSVILQGPKLVEDGFRRSQCRLFDKGAQPNSFVSCRFPRLYHLDFELIVTTARESELLDFQTKCSRFLQINPLLVINDSLKLNLTELVPLGGLSRVNLSNLKQSAGRLRIESCPVFDGQFTTGSLIQKPIIQFKNTNNQSQR